MATTLGSLIVNLGLNAAEFTAGLNKAEYNAKQMAAKFDKAIAQGARVAADSIAAIGIAAAGAYVAVMKLSSEAANFKDLEEKTGASAESLARFAPAAAVAGTSVETVAAAMNKMAKGLTSVEDETKDAGAALAALGINVEQFKSLTPDEQIRTLAKAFSSFGDGAGKSAAAMAIMGKSGAELLPFMKELASETSTAGSLTQKQIELADEYHDRQARVRAELMQYAQALATMVLPAITDFIKTVKELAKELVGVGTDSKKLRDDNGVVEFANNASRALGFVIDAADGVGRIFNITGNVLGATAAQIAALSRGDLAAYNAIQEDASRVIDGIIAKQTFRARLEKNIADTARNEANRAKEDRGFKPNLPQVNFKGKDVADKGGADNLAKSLLEGQIKDLESFIKQEKDILSARESYLSDSFNAGYLSVSAYFDETQKARDDHLEKVLASYDAEIAATEAYGRTLTKEADKQANANKVGDIRDKQAEAIRKAGFEADKFERERARANEEWARQLDELTAKTLELRGQTAEANALRASSAQQGLRRRLESSGVGTVNLDFQNKVAEDQERLNTKTRDYQLLLEQLGTEQQRIAILTTAGYKSELDSLASLTSANQKALGSLEEALTKAEDAAAELVRTLGPDAPLAKAALQQVDQLKLKFLELATTGDLVARKFNDVFGTNFASALEKAVLGTGTLKERFKAFFNDIASGVSRDITAIFSKDLAQKAFGQDGPLSFLGDTFSKILGGGAKDTALITAGTTLTTAGTSLTSAATELLFAASSLAASAGASGGSGAGGIFSSLLGLFGGGGISAGGGGFTGGWEFGGPQFGFAAGGTDYWRGGPLMVGENGPELLTRVPAGARVTPNHRLRAQGGGGGVVINQTIPPNVDTRSVRQATLAGVHSAQSAWSRR